MNDIIAGDPAPTNPLYSVQQAALRLLIETGYTSVRMDDLAEQALREGAAAGEIPSIRVDKRLLFSLGDLYQPNTVEAFLRWLKRASAEDARKRLAADKVQGAREAADWNERYPVGTPVIAFPCTRNCAEHTLTTKTRTPAWTLGHGEPLVSVEGHSGGIVLDHIDVIAKAGESR